MRITNEQLDALELALASTTTPVKAWRTERLWNELCVDASKLRKLPIKSAIDYNESR